MEPMNSEDFSIGDNLVKLSPKKLEVACQKNKRYSELCKDPKFWESYFREKAEMGESSVDETLLKLTPDALLKLQSTDEKFSGVLNDPNFWEKYFSKRKRRVPEPPSSVLDYYLDQFNVVNQDEVDEVIAYLQYGGFEPDVSYSEDVIVKGPSVEWGWENFDKKFSKYPFSDNLRILKKYFRYAGSCALSENLDYEEIKICQIGLPKNDKISVQFFLHNDFKTYLEDHLTGSTLNWNKKRFKLSLSEGRKFIDELMENEFSFWGEIEDPEERRREFYIYQ